MAAKSSKPVIDFGDAQNMAPSLRRVDLLGWLCAGAVFGAAAAWAALWLAWRPWPGLPEPRGSLGAHAGAVLRLAIHWLFPPAFGVSSDAYVTFLKSLPPPEARALVWRACFGAWAFALPSILLAKWCLAPRDALTVVRGAARHEGAKAVALLNAALATGVKARPDHEIAPGVRYPSDMWSRHVLLVAGVGSGKSTALRRLIRTVLRAGESILLFDPKGEFTKGFAGPDILAPWDVRSLAWDIAKDMRNVGDMRRFAASMIRDSTDPMWGNAARQILVGFMIHLKSTREREWGWRELADLMALPQARILPMMADCHPEAIRAVERASVTTQGILINLAAFSASIFDLASAWGDLPAERRVSFVDWTLQEGPRRQIILQGSGAYPDLTKSCLEGILGTVSAIVNSVEMDDDEARKLWLICDECPQMGKFPRALLEVGRSRGLRCVLACQDLAQMEEINGAHMAKSLVSMVGTIIVGQLSQGESAEQMCKAMGTREVERANVSTSMGGGGSAGSATLSFAREEIALYKPSELASRLGPDPAGKGVRLAVVCGGNAYELLWPWFPPGAARRAHVPAEWTKGVPSARWRAEDASTAAMSEGPAIEAGSDAGALASPELSEKGFAGEELAPFSDAEAAVGLGGFDGPEDCASDEDGGEDPPVGFAEDAGAPVGPSRDEVAESLRASLAWRARAGVAGEDEDRKN